jgi:hypothetical protein
MILISELNKLPKYKKEIISYIFDKSQDREIIFLKQFLELPKCDVEKFEKNLTKALEPYKKEAVTLDVEATFSEENYFDTSYFK